ncbi:porin [Paraburkholderia sp. BL25I1N1]|uniref:porin n=1 Tax=Paraburkholderia sp. BL25I1N1 TaxID=1938804 RepID=UPI000D06C842|nr:porin [Paraburkholderia sp. BL25I1N1]PRY06364.1 putative outer membrane protein [Paraburkholderia sp. BL25I1N1]
MKRIPVALAVSAAFAASAAHAQSSVTLYGLIDAGLMYTNNVKTSATAHGSLVQATSGNINGSRFGMRGAEDLGGGLKAIFVLENGFNVQNGRLGQNGRMFGRQAFVGLSSEFGTVTLGRQYDSLVDFLAPLSGTAGTFGDTGFAHPFDNDNLNHTLRMSNAVKYTSSNYAGLKFGGLYAFSNSTDFTLNRAYSAGASFDYGPFKMAAGYLQINGNGAVPQANASGAVDLGEAASTTGGFRFGADVQRTFGAGLSYTFGPAVVGFVYTNSHYQGTQSFNLNNGSQHFDNYELNAKYTLTPAVTLGITDTYTDAHLSGAFNATGTKYGSDPKWNQVNLQAVYALSKRTDVYAEGMYQHAIGQNVVAFINTAGGASSTANQVVGTVGMRTRF